jgi:hypothetical protein
MVHHKSLLRNFYDEKIKIISSAFEGKPSTIFEVSRNDNWTDHESSQEIDD